MMPKGQADPWSRSRGEDFNNLLEEENMGNKLYVGGLPYSVTEGRLQEIFAEHATVESAKVIIDKFTGQSRGFGFVEMASGGEAQRAIQALNGTQLDGRSLVVNEAKPMERRDGGGGVEETEAAGATAGNILG
jgi:RNA recognition motif-containing protein